MERGDCIDGIHRSGIRTADAGTLVFIPIRLAPDTVRQASCWDRLASLLAAGEGKKLLVIDEFQYLCKANPAFSSVMQRLYDTVLKPAGVMVILCGSHINMMESETLNYESPLYGRRDAQIRLGPIPFRYYHSFCCPRSSAWISWNAGCRSRKPNRQKGIWLCTSKSGELVGQSYRDRFDGSWH